jgi:hypothetical protein
MGKTITAIQERSKKSNEEMLSKMKEKLGAKWSCCVLITCTEPEENGKMEVEMTFEGDEMLAAFLVDNAAQVFEERSSLRESKYR